MIAAIKDTVRPIVHAAEARLTAPRYYYKDGVAYPALVHPYNKTWQCERQVEVPEALHLIDGYRHVLEVGNVLGHYVKPSHAVIDKYEQAPGVLNKDIMDFRAGQQYDAVVAVSTLEHIGFDEEEYARQNGREATPHHYTPVQIVDHLKGMVRPGGRLVMTTSLGYNPAWDDAVLHGLVGTCDTFYRKVGGVWHSCSAGLVDVVPYRPGVVGWASALWIGIYDKESKS